jgi:L,D-transpeptidase catalytic domain
LPVAFGRHVSSGCIRMANEDVIDLYNRVQIGAKVIVLPQTAVAKSEHASLTNAYALQPQSRAQATWSSIRPQDF